MYSKLSFGDVSSYVSQLEVTFHNDVYFAKV